MRRRFAWPVLALVVAVASMTPAPASAADASLPAAVALDWNAAAVNAVRAARTMDGVAPGGASRALYQTEGLLYMSYVQAAVYDATMKVSHRYLPYHHFLAPAGNASPTAAVIAAYYNTVVAYLGDPGGSLAAKYASDIGALPADANTARGIAVGQAASADIVQLRANDGRNAPISDACPTDTTPGAWRCAPAPSIQSEQTPWLAVMQPFMLTSDSQFRAPAPPALGSAQYLADLQETRDFGAVDSAVRTPDETAVAWFWNANAINQLNQTMRGAATQYSLDLVDTVRLLAAGEMISTDAGIACFDSKYQWLRWRPVTAIRFGSDFNDPSWTPLVTTPNHPEYPSQHGCITSAFSQVLASLLGTSNFNVTYFGATNGGSSVTTSKVFASPQAVNTELVNARVWIGFHYRASVVNGEAVGNSVAGWTLERFFLPGDGQTGD
jgi:hypothetical protein